MASVLGQRRTRRRPRTRGWRPRPGRLRRARSRAAAAGAGATPRRYPAAVRSRSWSRSGWRAAGSAAPECHGTRRTSARTAACTAPRRPRADEVQLDDQQVSASPTALLTASGLRPCDDAAPGASDEPNFLVNHRHHQSADHEKVGVPVETGLTEPLSDRLQDLPFLVVDNRSEVREFVASSRARITPEQAGLPVFGGTRRVPGVRREEVAMLAGVSVDYNTRLEAGEAQVDSESVLEALARALRLDEAERAHLFELARAAGPTARTRRRPAQQRVRPSVQRILDAMTGAPALVQNGRPRRPRREPARARPALGDVRRPGPAAQPRPVHLLQPASARLLPRLGPRRERHRGDPARRGRPRPVRPRPV
jgi:transcriptional regulator with XRE-family HTH domain